MNTQRIEIAGLILLLAIGSHAALQFGEHSEPAQVTSELSNLDRLKEDGVTFSTRAPTSGDKGRLWVKYTAASDTTISLYIRHPNSGTWRKVDLT